VYFNVNLKLLTKLINSAFVGEGTTANASLRVDSYLTRICTAGVSAEVMEY